MRKHYLNALKILMAAFGIILITSCPSPITEALVAAVEDSFVPAITITSPDYGSKYKSEVTISGRIEDNAISDGDGKGAISELSYSAGSLNRYKGRIYIDSAGQVTQDESQMDNPGDPVLRAYESIIFDPVTGNFSFGIDSSLFSGPMQFEINAVDRNNNTSTTYFSLNQSGGPFIEITSPVNSLYTPGEVLHVAGKIGDSDELKDTIGEIAELKLEIPALYITGADSIILDVAAGVAAGDPLISETSYVYGIFNFVLDTSTGEFSADIQIADSEEGLIVLDLYVTDKNGLGEPTTKNLSKNTGNVAIFLQDPVEPAFYSPSSTISLPVTGTFSPKDYLIDTLVVTVTSSNLIIPEFSKYSKDFISDYSSSTGSFSGTIDLTAASGAVILSVDATTAIGGDSTASRGLSVDATPPTVNVSSFSVGSDGNNYARGGETANLYFNISDIAGSGVDWATLDVSIGGLPAVVIYDAGSGVCSAYVDLPPQTGADPGYSSDILPYLIEVKDLVQNPAAKNQTVTPLITYYHKAPDTLNITLENLSNSNNRVPDGDSITITIPTGRDMVSSSIDLILDGTTFPFSLTDLGSEYKGTFPISDPAHPEGDVDYSFDYEDPAGNTATYDNGAVPVLYVDYSSPYLSGEVYSSTSGSDWATDESPQHSLKAVFTLNDDIDGNSLSDANHSPTVRFTDSLGASYNVVPDFSLGTWTATLAVTDSMAQNEATCTIIADDLAGNTGTHPFANTITIDTNGPDINSVDFATNGTSGTWAKSAEIIHLYFTMSDTVDGSLTGGTSGLTAPVVTLTQAGGDTTSGNAAWSSGNSRWEFLYTVPNDSTSPEQGKVGYSIAAVDVRGIVTEDADATLAYSFSTRIIDTKTPEFSVSSVSGDNGVSGYVGEELVTVEFTMTDSSPGDPVVTFDGNAADLTESTGGDGWRSTYIVDFSETDGELTIGISFADLAGNIGSASDALLESLTVDKSAPTISGITITSNSGIDDFVTDGNTVTIEFDAADNLTFNSGNLNVTTPEGANSVSSVSTGSIKAWKATYTVNETDDASGSLSFLVTATDLVGNESSLGSSSLTFDNKGPVIGTPSISGDINNWFADTGEATVTFNLTDEGPLSVTSFDVSDSGGLNDPVKTFVAGSPDVGGFTYVFGESNNDGTVIVTIDATDHFGNISTLDVDLDYDNKIPTVSLNSPNPKGTILAINLVTITFNISDNATTDYSDVSLFTLTADARDLKTTYSSLTHTGGGNWTVTFVPGAVDANGLTISLTAVDEYGHQSTTATNTEITAVN